MQQHTLIFIVWNACGITLLLHKSQMARNTGGGSDCRCVPYLYFTIVSFLIAKGIIKYDPTGSSHYYFYLMQFSEWTLSQTSTSTHCSRKFLKSKMLSILSSVQVIFRSNDRWIFFIYLKNPRALLEIVVMILATAGFGRKEHNNGIYCVFLFSFSL